MSDSKHLLSFIKKYNIPRFSKLSEKSKKIISKIVGRMEEAVRTWDRSYNDTILDLSNGFPKGRGYHHIVEEIKQDFENQPKIGKQYSFSIGSRIFNIYLISPIKGSTITPFCIEDVQSNRSNPFISAPEWCIPKGGILNENWCKMYKAFDKLINKMYIWLFVCSYFASDICSPIIDIYIYMTQHKKKIPEISNIPIDQIHANTAFTSACPHTSNEIYVFREEEWFKVFIHESFHTFGLDFATMDEKETENKMFSIFPLKYDLRFYETYTEMWAEIINVIFISVNTYSCNEKTISINKLSNIIENHLHNEQLFSLFQCSKVLHHMGLKYRELYEINGDLIKRDQRYNEKTHVFSYYVLKCIIMFYYNDFIEWCCIHNNMSIQFTKTQENINSLFEFIKSRYNSSDFLRTIEIFENQFTKEDNQLKKIESETMRMSISE